MLKCPRCESDAKDSGKTWTYHVFQAKLCYCSACRKRFIAYYSEGHLSHTIPMGHDIRATVLKYLRTHKSASLDEIAITLKLDALDVFKIVMELQRQGMVESIQ